MQDRTKGWNRRQWMATAAAGAALGGWSARSLAQDANTPIVLGQSCALSGPSAQLGSQFSQGAKLYFDQLNAQGGIGRLTGHLVGFGRMVKKQAITAVERVGAAVPARV